MNKPVYLGLLIMQLNKALIYEFWYDYLKPKYGEKAKFLFLHKTDGIHKDIEEDVETGLGTSNYNSDTLLLKGKIIKLLDE